MITSFKCKNCGIENEISEAFITQIENQALQSEREKHIKELADTKRETEIYAKNKAREEYGVELQSLKQESSEEKERNLKLLKQLELLGSEIRELRRKDEERELEMNKRLSEAEDNLKVDIRKKVNEEHELKDLEKDKKLTDALRQIDDLKQKIQQGSQQTQGEVLEMQIEDILKKSFPNDDVSEVKKGQRGADIIQSVVDTNGKQCGKILWESKNAQWTDTWIEKLKADQRLAKADLAVLVSTNLPKEIETFVYRNGVWITSRKLLGSLALALRYNLVKVHFERQANVGKNEKMEELYSYITSIEFSHRIESIVGWFTSRQQDIEKERRYFETKWSKEEKQIRQLTDYTHGIFGDLQGVVGNALPDIKSLQISSGED